MLRSGPDCAQEKYNNERPDRVAPQEKYDNERPDPWFCFYVSSLRFVVSRRQECFINATKVYAGLAVAGSLAHADRQYQMCSVCE